MSTWLSQDLNLGLMSMSAYLISQEVGWKRHAGRELKKEAREVGVAHVYLRRF